MKKGKMKSTTLETTHKLLASTALGLLLVIPRAADAQYAFATIDVPGATRTSATGNSTTALAGEFDDANGNTHGFILSKGVFTTVDVPGAAATGLNGINASGSFTG